MQTPAQSSPETIAAAIDLLNTAERPAILAGRGIAGSGSLLLDLAEKWQSGIALTMPAKGRLPGEHPLVMGGLGEGGSEASTALLNKADIIFMIGATWWLNRTFLSRTVVQLISSRKISAEPRCYVWWPVEEVLPVISGGLVPNSRLAQAVNAVESDRTNGLPGNDAAEAGATGPLVAALEG